MDHLADLEVFARIVSEGSMSAAGRQMGLSPAVISKRIRRLEDRLGVRLLQRTTRQVALTEAGQGFYERVLAILSSVEEAVSFAAGRSSTTQGTLKVSAPTTFGRMHIAPHLKPFLAANSGLTLQIELTDAFVDIVGEGFDLAIRIADLEDSSLVARRLAPSHRVLCASPLYLAERGTPATMAELDGHALLSTQTQDVWRLEGPEGAVSLKPQGPVRTNSSELVREAVIAGLGIALRSTWDVGHELRDGRLKVVLPNWRASRRVGVYAVYPTRRFLPAKVRVFIDFLARIYGPLPYWDEGLDVGPDPFAGEEG